MYSIIQALCLLSRQCKVNLFLMAWLRLKKTKKNVFGYFGKRIRPPNIRLCLCERFKTLHLKKITFALRKCESQSNKIWLPLVRHWQSDVSIMKCTPLFLISIDNFHNNLYLQENRRSGGFSYGFCFMFIYVNNLFHILLSWMQMSVVFLFHSTKHIWEKKFNRHIYETKTDLAI